MENDLMFNVLCRIVEFVYGGELFNWVLYIGLTCLTISIIKDYLKEKKGK